MNYINTWGLYHCFRGNNEEMIDPECRGDFLALQPNGKVFQCISAKNDKIALKYGEKVFWVDPKLYKIVREPMYKVGDRIEIVEKLLVGQVTDVNWHIKDDVPFYFVEINGKKKKTRYRDCDLRDVKSER